MHLWDKYIVKNEYEYIKNLFFHTKIYVYKIGLSLFQISLAKTLFSFLTFLIIH